MARRRKKRGLKLTPVTVVAGYVGIGLAYMLVDAAINQAQGFPSFSPRVEAIPYWPVWLGRRITGAIS